MAQPRCLGPKKSPSVLKMNKQRRQNSSSFLLCWDAMAELLELGPVAALAIILASKGMGRERRARGFYFGKSGHGRWRWATAAAAAMVMATGSPWRALLGQREG